MRRRRTRHSRGGDQPMDPAMSTPNKRQRVSIACDPCRTAKAKCDGDRPRCGTCLLQSKTCSYTHASRKRGVPTGYLRSMEVAIGWLFEHYPGSEAALHRLLSRDDDADSVHMLMTNNNAGGRFHGRWIKSSVYRDISKLVSGEIPGEADGPMDEPESQGNVSSTNSFSIGFAQPHLPTPTSIHPHIDLPIDSDHLVQEHLPPKHRRLKLPTNWKHLIEVYFTYTGCWFPIIERDSVIRTASSYLEHGIYIELDRASSLHVQLWSVLAVASFQDAASSKTTPGSLSPGQIYSIACDLSATENGLFEAPYISSILLQSLIQIGQRKEVQAWLLIGKASRLALSSVSPATSSHSSLLRDDGFPSHQLHLILIGSFILDTLVSIYLGRPEAAGSGRLVLPTGIYTRPAETQEGWVPILNSEQVSGQNSVSKYATLQQLYKFCQLWVRVSDSKKPTPEDLLSSLDPQFSFCNSLIFGGSIPETPSAFLVQAMLVTITLCLTPTPRPTQYLNLLELVELCIEKLDACGVPPLIIILVGIIHQSGPSVYIHEGEKARWKSSLDSLKCVWAPDRSRKDCSVESPTAESQSDHTHAVDPFFAHDTGATNVIRNSFSILDHCVQRQSTLLCDDRLPSMASNSQQESIDRMGRECLQHGVEPLDETHHYTDYDAILDELGSISYADTMDTNSRFMENLGFAPGYDLGEMFLSDFNT